MDGTDSRFNTSTRDNQASSEKWGEVAGQSVSGTPIPPPLNLVNMREFLLSPIPQVNGIVQCYIRREKSGTNKFFPEYELFLKVGG